jgi:hypothetical protein
MLFTHTASHSREDLLGDLLRRHQHAMRWFFKQRATKDTLRSHGSIGRITALEVTWGIAAGWHPHKHLLMFLDRPLMRQDQHRCKRLWLEACRRSGLHATFERGLDIRGGDDEVGAYVSKLGLEVALTQVKKGRGSSSVPAMGLLDLARAGDKHAESMWLEYAHSMGGRSSIRWSKGLKAHFGIGEVSDDELVDAKADEDEVHAMNLLREGLKVLGRGIDVRGEFLTLCGLAQWDAAGDLLERCGGDRTWLYSVKAEHDEDQ